MDIKNNLIGFANWCVGTNNRNSIKKLNENSYLFNGNTSPTARKLQYSEEIAKIVVKWATLSGMAIQLTNDTGLTQPWNPISPLGIIQTLGNYPYSAIKNVASSVFSTTESIILSTIFAEDKPLLAANIALTVSAAVALKSIWNNLATIEAIKYNHRIKDNEKTLKYVVPIINIALAAALPIIAYTEQTSEGVAFMATVGIINELATSKYGLKFAKPLVRCALITAPYHAKILDLSDQLAILLDLPTLDQLRLQYNSSKVL